MAKTCDLLGAVLCLCVCLIVVFTQHLGLEENDICKQQDGLLWACQNLRNCPSAQADLKRGKRPEICTFVGNNPIVCCQPDLKNRMPPESQRISSQKCKEYGKAVFNKVESPIGDGFIEIDTCALVEPLITNGTPANPREYPHMALIGYGPKNNIDWLCGGSLISERFVLSAAHCTNAGSKGLASWVRLGDYDIFSTDDDKNRHAESREYQIIERINHPEYKSPSVYNDIALYKLKDTIKFNEYVRPICLQIDHTFAKTYALGTGWGRVEWGGKQSGVLQKVNLTIIGRKECVDTYKASIGPKLKNGIVDASQLCAGDLANGKDTCKGDSGGPLQIRLREPYCMYSQVGITSFGVRCAANYPGVYTRVSHYVPWIESVVWA
ncbi:serine protease snake-like [Macrosteles quadrilineatus]|uniref:serine protease snake-like n=1 Tax=Macrosteles quadrilineatus TaxID=74068 RepID=UPI0023E1D86E|nr:serine protease snake-like [Macrosteles quadrilineatus]